MNIIEWGMKIIVAMILGAMFFTIVVTIINSIRKSRKK